MKRGDKIRATHVKTNTIIEGIADYADDSLDGGNVEFADGSLDIYADNGWTFEVLESPIAVGDVIDASRLKELPVGSLVRGDWNGLNGMVASEGLVSIDLGGDGHVTLSFADLRNGYHVLHIAELPEV